MNDKKRKVLEAAGYRVGDVADFLRLSAEERALVELRAAVSAAVRRLRTDRHLTQAELAAVLRSSQSRVAKVEAGSTDVSLDLMFRSLFAVGGRVADVLDPHPTARPADRGRRRGRGRRSLRPVVEVGLRWLKRGREVWCLAF
jgi:transcriptional regulator with XRE-family HTH domain